MNPKLRDAALIAEVISGVAVVVTLIFLIAQVRDNSSVIRGAAFEGSIDSLNELRLMIAEDHELASLMIDRWGRDLIEEFGRDEAPAYLQRRLMTLVQWSNYEKAYYSRNYDLLGTAEWSRFERSICLTASNPASRWSADIKDFLTPEFADYVIEFCNLGP